MPRGLRQCWLPWSRIHSRRKSFSDALRSGRIKGILSRDSQQIKGKLLRQTGALLSPPLRFDHLRCFNDRPCAGANERANARLPRGRISNPRSWVWTINPSFEDFFSHPGKNIAPLGRAFISADTMWDRNGKWCFAEWNLWEWRKRIFHADVRGDARYVAHETGYYFRFSEGCNFIYLRDNLFN